MQIDGVRLTIHFSGTCVSQDPETVAKNWLEAGFGVEHAAHVLQQIEKIVSLETQEEFVITFVRTALEKSFFYDLAIGSLLRKHIDAVAKMLEKEYQYLALAKVYRYLCPQSIQLISRLDRLDKFFLLRRMEFALSSNEATNVFARLVRVFGVTADKQEVLWAFMTEAYHRGVLSSLPFSDFGPDLFFVKEFFLENHLENVWVTCLRYLHEEHYQEALGELLERAGAHREKLLEWVVVLDRAQCFDRKSQAMKATFQREWKEKFTESVFAPS